MAVMCPLCSRDEALRIFESRDRVHGVSGLFTVFQCHQCGAVFYEPRLSEAELSRYYPDTYGRYRHSRSLTRKSYRSRLRRFVLENRYGYPSRDGHDSDFFKRGVASLLSVVMARKAIPYRGDGNFLDVGCGSGSFLYRLKQWGWNGYGVEPNAAAVAQARLLGLDVHHGQIEDAGFPANCFDVVRLSHVLEHLSEPKRTLREIERVVKLDGIVYVTVPNTRSLNFWLFKENWYGLDAPRHVISYSPKTLKSLCDAAGFKILKIRFRSGAFNFVRSVQYYLEEKGDGWPQWVRRINWPSNRFIRRTLKPFFYFLDLLRCGDIMEVTLQKCPGE